MTVRLFRVALVALVLAERPLAALFVAFHAVAVEGRHAVGDELRGLDVSVADRAVGIAGVHVHGLPGGGQLAVVRKGMAACAAPSCPRRTIPDGSLRTWHVPQSSCRGCPPSACRGGRPCSGRVPARCRRWHDGSPYRKGRTPRHGPRGPTSRARCPYGGRSRRSSRRPQRQRRDPPGRSRRSRRRGTRRRAGHFRAPPPIRDGRLHRLPCSLQRASGGRTRPVPGVFEQEADRRFPNRVMSIAYDRHHGHQTAKNGDKDMTSWHDKHSLS